MSTRTSCRGQKRWPLVAVALFLMGMGCGGPRYDVYYTTGSRLQAAIHELHQDRPEVFDNPFTLVIAVDASPCTKLLKETIWWRDWQRTATECGYGFVFVTSQTDSGDVMVTASLDGVAAPVLVLPSCKNRLSELDVPDIIPLNLLVDSTSTIRYSWGPLIDSVENQDLMDKLDSLCQTTASTQGRSQVDQP